MGAAPCADGYIHDVAVAQRRTICGGTASTTDGASHGHYHLCDVTHHVRIHNGVGTLVDEDDGYAAFNNNTLASYGYSYGYYTQFKKLY